MRYYLYIMAYRRIIEKHYKWRNGSVPFVHKSNTHRGSVIRRPQTFNERRFNHNHNISEAKEFNLKVRKARLHQNLVSEYDDIVRPCYRTWKKYRKTQYK